MINKLVVIGVGLIGGSLARALRRADAVGEIVGVGRSRANMEKALSLGVIDRIADQAHHAVSGAEVIFIGATLGATERILEDLAGVLGNDTILTDAGSTKSRLTRHARNVLGENFSRFVPGHPIAGTEESGVEASFPELFERHKVILTPVAETDGGALAQVESMWRTVGAEVVKMDPDKHDRLLAATSHLPHVLAYGLVDALARRADAEEIFDYAAGGFRDFTRIASSNPEMWRDISLANAAALADVLNDFSQVFAELSDAIRSGDAAAIERIYARAKQTRDRVVMPSDNRS
ncbi:MAG: prephenate dehydrogenase/arogenate dehydrogenase family protein [Pseudomonadota bacterium]